MSNNLEWSFVCCQCTIFAPNIQEMGGPHAWLLSSILVECNAILFMPFRASFLQSPKEVSCADD